MLESFDGRGPVAGPLRGGTPAEARAAVLSWGEGVAAAGDRDMLPYLVRAWRSRETDPALAEALSQLDQSVQLLKREQTLNKVSWFLLGLVASALSSFFGMYPAGEMFRNFGVVVVAVCVVAVGRRRWMVRKHLKGVR
ncbi:MAG: hypothetical protein ACRDT8_07775 [Micromonosporaceae bacterium]